ncbi:MAG: hypothetical protein ACRDDY_10790 [Clostridium sp.]|uniref:hypothetical protein n=1 Tax=Clostridium sp. TaxID=1506 RepID=UPI003EE4972A
MIKVKTLENYNNVLEKYYVTTCGKIISSEKNGFKILKPNINKKGYHQCRMYCDDKSSLRPYIHKVVALAFIKNIHNLDQVDHLDMNKENNCVKNLEWVNNLENMKRRNKKLGSVNSKLTPEDVIFIRKNYRKWREGRIWKSNAIEFSKRFNVSAKVITNCANGLSYKDITE